MNISREIDEVLTRCRERCEAPCKKLSAEVQVSMMKVPNDQQSPALEKWIREKGRNIRAKDLIILEVYLSSMSIKVR